jgi:hypothetical protein
MIPSPSPGGSRVIMDLGGALRRRAICPTASGPPSSLTAMDALAGPYLASAALLVAAGVSKLADPLSLVRALRSARLPGSAAVVRLLAAGEVLLGLAAVVLGARPAAVLVALSYAAFTGFVLLARRRGGVLASCGCFGKADTPPTASHVAVTAGLAAVACAVAVRPLGPLPALLDGAPGAGVPLLLASAAVGATAYLVLALLPGLQAAR